MTEEEKKAAEAQAKAEAEEKAKAERENETDEEREAREAEEETRSQIDYEAELKRERERREAAEKAAAEIAFKLREQKRKEGEFEEDEEKPLTAKELEAILQKDRQQTRKEIQSEIISEKVRKLAGSAAEAELIIEVHKNRVFPEGLSLDEQLEESYAIANRKTLMAKNEELKRALRSKETISGDTAGTYREFPVSGEPKSSLKDISTLKAAGFIWDGKLNLWKKETKERVITVSKDLKTRKVIAK